jgi:G3E family GTPase
MMKTTIVCGLLGAGKTTFVRQLLRDTRERTVVLVNDFGQTGIDGEIFSADGIESIELPSGCVCCTLKFDLITTIQKIISTLSPAHLVIEPSGVASPSAVLETLETLKISPVTVVGIVDSTEFVELHESRMYGSFFEDQIVNSDIVLVNKTDLVDEEKVRCTLSLVERLNPWALTFPAVNAAISVQLPEIVPGPRSLNRQVPHFHFETLSLRMNSMTDFAFYENFFEDLVRGMYGDVVRAKALAQTDRGPFRFDLSFGRVAKTPFAQDIRDNRLVIIGQGLKREVLLLLSTG